MSIETELSKLKFYVNELRNRPSTTSTTTILVSGSATPIVGNTFSISGTNGITFSSTSNKLIISQAAAGGAGLLYFTESLPSFTAGGGGLGTTVANSFNVVRAGQTDAHLLLLPKGNGGLVLGPATGQSRGQYAVDLSIHPAATFAHGARATYATIGGGGGNQYITTDGDYATIAGGRDCSINAPYGAIPGGRGSSTKYQTGKFAFSSNNADYSTGMIVYRGITTNGSTTVSLTSDGAAVNTGIYPPGTPANVLLVYLSITAIKIRAEIVARSSDGLAKAWTLEALATNAGIIGATTTAYGTDLAAATVAFRAQTGVGLGDGITIDVTGVTAKTIRWAATLYTTEVSFLQ